MSRVGARAICLVALCSTIVCTGFARKPPAQPTPVPVPSVPLAKKGIALAPVERTEIEMPDGGLHAFGEDFQASLTTKLLQTGRYWVTDASKQDSVEKEIGMTPEWLWPSTVLPSAEVRVRVKSLLFITGARGDRMQYGFDARTNTTQQKNEFPLKDIEFEANWFDRQFDVWGTPAFDSRVGLDLGQGLSIDLLFAWLHLKYAQYQSVLDLEIEIRSPWARPEEPLRVLPVQTRGKGYFYDWVGAYTGYSLGIKLGRGDAMLQSVKKAIDGTMARIEQELAPLPGVARVDAYQTDRVFLGTGKNAQVPPGVRYEAVDQPGLVLEVVRSDWSGSEMRFVGSGTSVRLGQIFREVRQGSAIEKDARVLEAGVTVQQPVLIDLPAENLPHKPLTTDLGKDISRAQAFWEQLQGLVLLPYRIWRYNHYDQAYHAQAEPEQEQKEDPIWSTEVGAADSRTVVAVVGSGVDYNHPRLHGHLWNNPSPLVDSRGRQDLYGWDFISGDAHPFDDQGRGTQAAGLIAEVAPLAQLIPLKVFNPWGITSSQALESGIDYAVEHGAQVILCPWGTSVRSEALERAVKRADAKGVWIVTGAGDHGNRLRDQPMYPASHSAQYSHVVSVAALARTGELLKEKGRYTNYDDRLVQIAAPGEKLETATPRGHYRRESSSYFAAALVAGLIARQDLSRGLSREDLLEVISERKTELSTKIEQGRVLRVRPKN